MKLRNEVAMTARTHARTHLSIRLHELTKRLLTANATAVTTWPYVLMR